MTLIVKGVTIPTNGDFIKYGGTNVTKVNVKIGSAAAVTVWEKQTFTTREFGYTGGMQSVVVPPGLYKLEVWGAQGGNSPSGGTGGYGGYSCRYTKFSSQTTLYVCVGGRGNPQPGGNGYEGGGWTAGNPPTLAKGGYNGGGVAITPQSYTLDSGTGGGATHIATANGVLSSLSGNRSAVIVVAGGGGGGSYLALRNGSKYYGTGGAGGGLNGNDGVTSYGTPGKGASQTAGGTTTNNGGDEIYGCTTYNGSFGQGGYCTITAFTGGGGGGGYYGGGGGANNNGATPGGGGSGYLGGMQGYSHNGTYYANQSTAGSRAGDGYAKITFVAA